MQLYVKDAVMDTAHLPSDVFKAYWLLTFKAWAGIEGQPQGYLGDEQRLQELSGSHPREWARIKERVLALFFRSEDGRYYSKRCIEEAERLRIISEKRAESGRAGARSAWQVPSDEDGKCHTQKMANAIDDERQKDGSASASFSSPKTPKKKGTREGSEDWPGMPLPPELSSDPFASCWAEFRQYRRDKRKPMSAKAEAMTLKRLASYGPQIAAAALEQSMANDWQGVFPEKVTTSGGKPVGTAEAYRYRRIE